eukprot:scpid71083/ scgid24160/ 
MALTMAHAGKCTHFAKHTNISAGLQLCGCAQQYKNTSSPNHLSVTRNEFSSQWHTAVVDYYQSKLLTSSCAQHATLSFTHQKDTWHSYQPFAVILHPLQTFLAAFQPVINGSSTTGTFADACLTHCQSMSNAWSEYKIGGQLMRETFADWYFQRTTGKGREMDGPYPSNPTCPHHVTELDFATNVV